MFYWFSFYIILALGALFSPRSVSGSENLPRSGSYIIASNHVSNLDPFLIGLSVRRRISYMAKDTLFKNPMMRVLLKWVETFPVRRESSDIKALRESLRRLNRGLPVLVFPEGTRRASGAESKTQAGIGFLAVKGNVPVIPAHIEGSDKVLPKGARFPRRNRVRITFGKPLIYSKERDYPAIVSDIMGHIQSLPDHP